ncbi:MAG UNVERIFIED_CONTAM: hypothetical protein LVT10_01990 [Anaerolineae bacterium]
MGGQFAAQQLERGRNTLFQAEGLVKELRLLRLWAGAQPDDKLTIPPTVTPQREQGDRSRFRWQTRRDARAMSSANATLPPNPTSKLVRKPANDLVDAPPTIPFCQLLEQAGSLVCETSAGLPSLLTLITCECAQYSTP